MFVFITASWLHNYTEFYTALVKFMDRKPYQQIMTSYWKDDLENVRICMANYSF